MKPTQKNPPFPNSPNSHRIVSPFVLFSVWEILLPKATASPEDSIRSFHFFLTRQCHGAKEHLWPSCESNWDQCHNGSDFKIRDDGNVAMHFLPCLICFPKTNAFCVWKLHFFADFAEISLLWCLENMGSPLLQIYPAITCYGGKGKKTWRMWTVLEPYICIVMTTASLCLCFIVLEVIKTVGGGLSWPPLCRKLNHDFYQSWNQCQEGCCKVNDDACELGTQPWSIQFKVALW